MEKAIAIMHHHLNPGGVTRVIHSQVKALSGYQKNWIPKIISGHIPKNAKLPVPVTIDERLNYLYQEDLKSLELNIAKNNLKAALEKMVDKEDIIHFHNLNLGKNPLVTTAIYELCEMGYHILNHAHDFAEDRPLNYNFLKMIIGDEFGYDLKQVLYPDAANYHFAVLNTFDYERLKTYGIDNERISLLPNPVQFESIYSLKDKKKNKALIAGQLGLDQDKKIITYPVRIIKRKNVGEFILLAMLFVNQAHWLVSQPPKNPVEIEPYEAWKQFCSDLNIPVQFEVGSKVNFEQLINASDFCITTSAREGFGMSYMEPWLMHTPVIGRNLPYVTDDIKQNGVKFPYLYNQIKIDWEGEVIDFKNMPEDRQREVIRKAKEDPDFRHAMYRQNPFLNDLLKKVSGELIETNKAIINREYSIAKYGEQLNGIYKTILE
ncbi:MAG: glycosyltransferase [Bacteroidales bacterium]|nr:glycosyltransferase [Bacteroidales bacterium]